MLLAVVRFRDRVISVRISSREIANLNEIEMFATSATMYDIIHCSSTGIQCNI